MEYIDVKTGMILTESEDPHTIAFITHKNDFSLRADLYEFAVKEEGSFSPDLHVDLEDWDEMNFWRHRVLLKELGILERRGLVERIMRVNKIDIHKRGG
jgi:hypothetical protein